MIFPNVLGLYMANIKRIRFAEPLLRELMLGIIDSYEKFGAVNLPYLKDLWKGREDIKLFMQEVSKIKVDYDERYAKYWVGKFLNGMVIDSIDKSKDKQDALREKIVLADDLRNIYEERYQRQIKSWNFFDESEKRLSYKDLNRYRLRTGIGLLDEQVAMVDGTVTVFMAPWKRYKSIILTNMSCLGVAQNMNGFHIHYEGKQSLWETRYDSCLTGLAKDRLYDRLNEGEKEKYRRVYSNLKKQGNQLYFMSGIPQRTGIVEIENEIAKLEKEGLKFQFIVVDYLNLMRPSSKSDDDWLRQGDLAWDLVYLAQKGYIVVTATQATRQGAVREILRPDDLGRTIIVAQAVDNLIAINQSEVEKAQDSIRMSPLSVRDGKITNSKVNLQMALYQMRISRECGTVLDKLASPNFATTGGS